MSKFSASRRLLFALIALLMILGGAEIGLRLLGFHYQRNLSFMQFNFPNPRELHQIFEPDPKLLWRMRPGFTFGAGFGVLNREGFRGPEFIKEKPAGTYRIVALGDSVTFGQPEVYYPDLLARRLSDLTGRPVEALNFGVPGYSSWQGRVLLARALRDYRPDLVIIFFGWNDHWLAQGFADKDQVPTAAKISAALSRLRKLRLYQFLNHELAWFREKFSPPPAVLRVAPEDYRANLIAMVQLCRDHAAVPILATAPSGLGQGPLPDYLTYLKFARSADEVIKLHHEYNNLTRETAKREGVILVDLDAAFQEKPDAVFFDHLDQDVIHPNPAGYRLITDCLAQTILRDALKK